MTPREDLVEASGEVAIREELVDPLTAAEPSLADQREQVQRMSEALAAGW